MGNKFFRSILIVISFLAASVGLASCGNTYTPSYDNLSFAVISEEEKICEVNGYKKYYNDERDNNIFIPKVISVFKFIISPTVKISAIINKLTFTHFFN